MPAESSARANAVTSSPSRSPLANGRTSSVWNQDTGHLAVTSIASSRLAHSRRSKPAMNSLVSANGPSVTSVLPSRTRTVAAVSGRSSSRPSSRTPRRSISSTQPGPSRCMTARSSAVGKPSSQMMKSAYFISASLPVAAADDRVFARLVHALADLSVGLFHVAILRAWFGGCNRTTNRNRPEDIPAPGASSGERGLTVRSTRLRTNRRCFRQPAATCSLPSAGGYIPVVPGTGDGQPPIEPDGLISVGVPHGA